MDIIKRHKLIIFVFLPFLLGWLINTSIFLINIYVFTIWIFAIGFIIYWFWVGKQFGQLRFNVVFNLLLGNIVWIISFGLFIWQFIFIDSLNRNLLLAGMSQHYGLFTLTFAAKIIKERRYEILWCNGRTIVQGYYQKLGFEPLGEVFDYPPIGLHIVMYKCIL